MLDRTGFGGGGGGGERGGGSGRGVAGPVDGAGRPSAAGGPELLCRLRRVTRQRLGCVSSFGRPAGPGGPPPLAVFAAPRHGPESLSASRLGIVVLDCGCYSVQTGMRWSGDTRVDWHPPPLEVRWLLGDTRLDWRGPRPFAALSKDPKSSQRLLDQVGLLRCIPISGLVASYCMNSAQPLGNLLSRWGILLGSWGPFILERLQDSPLAARNL